MEVSRMIDPHHFFLGKLSREESASAFLATLLEQHDKFRQFFFKECEIEQPQGPCQVSIEQEEVDIRLDYYDAKVVVLIENKVRPGALQVDQLVRYYRQTRESDVDSSIHSILVGPNEGSGQSEVDRLKRLNLHQDHPSDIVKHLSWRDLAEFPEEPKSDNPWATFVIKGFENVLKIMNDAAQEKYPLTNVIERQILHDVARAAFGHLSNTFPEMRLRLWRSKELFNIYPTGTDISLGINLVFLVEDKPPYRPLGIVDAQRITAWLETQVTLSAKGKSNHPLRAEWNRMLQKGEYDIPGLGLHTLGGRWFKRKEPFPAGDSASLQRELVRVGSAVITEAAKLHNAYPSQLA